MCRKNKQPIPRSKAEYSEVESDLEPQDTSDDGTQGRKHNGKQEARQPCRERQTHDVDGILGLILYLDEHIENRVAADHFGGRETDSLR